LTTPFACCFQSARRSAAAYQTPVVQGAQVGLVVLVVVLVVLVARLVLVVRVVLVLGLLVRVLLLLVLVKVPQLLLKVPPPLQPPRAARRGRRARVRARA